MGLGHAWNAPAPGPQCCLPGLVPESLMKMSPSTPAVPRASRAPGPPTLGVGVCLAPFQSRMRSPVGQPRCTDPICRLPQGERGVVVLWGSSQASVPWSPQAKPYRRYRLMGRRAGCTQGATGPSPRPPVPRPWPAFCHRGGPGDTEDTPPQGGLGGCCGSICPGGSWL